MSNARKLQTEIDRVLKKVDEGVELFDEIWEKVYSAEQQNQKEKYEMDLKKEIKKLQRLRDQIKSWISSAEVKDKDALFEARKLIETKMEAFKTCEKETKTKTYSKEGLARAEQLSPEEEAKRNTSAWISDSIERLQTMVQDQEVEIEKLQNGKGKKTNKNIIDECNHYIAMHKYHLNKLEGIMRLVNNDMLETDDVDPLREDLDYYMDSYKEDEYQQAYDEDFFYESLGLDDLPVVNVDRVTNPIGGSVGGSTGGGSIQNDKASKSSKNRDNEDVASSSSKGSKDKKGGGGRKGSATLIPLTIGRARKGGSITATPIPTTVSGRNYSGHNRDGSDDENSTGRQTPSKLTSGGKPMSSISTTPTMPTPTTIPATRLSSSGGVAQPQPSGGAAATAPPGASMAAILKRETEQQEKERQQQKAEQMRLQQQQLQAQQAAALRQQQEAQARQQQQQQQQQQEAALRQRQLQEAAAKQQALQEQQAQQQEAALRQQQAALQQQLQQAALQQQLQQQQQQQLQQQAAHDVAKKGLPTGTQGSLSGGTTVGGGGGGGLDIISGLNGLNLGGGGGNMIPGSLGALGGKSLVNDGGSIAGIPTSNGNVGYNLSAAVATANNSSMLQESFATLPTSNEQERARPYTPQNPYPATPPSYPSTPSTLFDNPAIFEKLGTDALFFIFYYQQGTYQQYLAARELKKQSWRFHKKYMTWFQRHEEPKLTTDEYEQGTYVYFDYETGWCTRIKQDFRFEYSFLEDSLQ